MQFAKKILLKMSKLRSPGRFFYLYFYRYSHVHPASILLESHHGQKIDGNIFYIAKELNSNPAYTDFKIYLSVDNKYLTNISKTLSHYGLARIKVVNNQSLKFYRLLASAKYLINDTSFTPYFIKKTGQIYLNTWHGTPLKTLGKKVSNAKQHLGNIQKNFLASDYLLYPNTYTQDHMVEDYMLNNIFSGKILLGGYPRNEVFFDTDVYTRIRNQLDVASKTVIAYMPTWRDATTSEEAAENSKTLREILVNLDSSLSSNQILYVNLHPMERGAVDFSAFAHIFPFPDEYEVYEFLAATDHLITDYSSVFFDYANYSEKITLFAYDYDLYKQTRGMYFELDELPFPLVKTVDALVEQLNAPSSVKLKAFLDKFCPYEQPKAAAALCQHVILDEKTLIERSVETNKKKNVLIYSSNLARNGITASLKNILSKLDTTHFNYFVTFVGPSVKTNNFNQLEPVLEEKHISYLPTTPFTNGSLFQKLILKLFERNYITAWLFLKLGGQSMLRFDIKRLFMDIDFSSIVMFNGYEDRNILFYNQFDAARSTIFVHNNMVEEIKLKKNQRRNVLRYAYQNYDSVAAVTEDMLDSINDISKNKANITIVKNIIPHDLIIEKSKNDITFNEDTLSNTPLSTIHTLLHDPHCYTLLTIGRFSPEKAHSRLIDAFDAIRQKSTQKIVLIIIGGYGTLYDETVAYAAKKESREDIIIIKSLDNPYPFLRLASGFILPSLHEGFGIVAAEADVLSKPVVTTNIAGPRTFMEKYGGTMVENSPEGVADGIQQLIEGSVPVMHVNYDNYNKEAVSQFESIIK